MLHLEDRLDARGFVDVVEACLLKLRRRGRFAANRVDHHRQHDVRPAFAQNADGAVEIEYAVLDVSAFDIGVQDFNLRSRQERLRLRYRVIRADVHGGVLLRAHQSLQMVHAVVWIPFSTRFRDTRSGPLMMHVQRRVLKPPTIPQPFPRDGATKGMCACDWSFTSVCTGQGSGAPMTPRRSQICRRCAFEWLITRTHVPAVDSNVSWCQ